ncbi:hypothetical protein Bca4012_086245 [Brassica carinata]
MRILTTGKASSFFSVRRNTFEEEQRNATQRAFIIQVSFSISLPSVSISDWCILCLLAGSRGAKKRKKKNKLSKDSIEIKTLCMAFYARSEEARQSHSVHKLALGGALALEDTLSKGLPIQKEIDMLQTYLEGIHQDSMLDLVLSSLPEEARSSGTDTVQQLNQTFNTLKGALRHEVKQRKYSECLGETCKKQSHHRTSCNSSPILCNLC